MGKPIELTDEFLAAFVKWMVPGMGGMWGRVQSRIAVEYDPADDSIPSSSTRMGSQSTLLGQGRLCPKSRISERSSCVLRLILNNRFIWSSVHAPQDSCNIQNAWVESMHIVHGSI